jgi:hypothetical protein
MDQIIVNPLVATEGVEELKNVIRLSGKLILGQCGGPREHQPDQAHIGCQVLTRGGSGLTRKDVDVVSVGAQVSCQGFYINAHATRITSAQLTVRTGMNAEHGDTPRPWFLFEFAMEHDWNPLPVSPT